MNKIVAMGVAGVFGLGLWSATASAAPPRGIRSFPNTPVRPFVSTPVRPFVPTSAVPLRPLAPVPPPPSPVPLRGFSLYNQVPFYTASISPNLPGSANAVLSPGLLRYQARAQALQNFGQFANVPPYAFYPPVYNFGPTYSAGYNPYAFYNPYANFAYGSSFVNPYAFTGTFGGTGY
jgi:hypothetical protein